MPSIGRTNRMIQAAATLALVGTTGTAYYVSSTSATKSDSAGSGLSASTPFATLAYALGTSTGVTANVGDVVFVMPGHAENIAAAGGITAKAGVQVFGQGVGSNRPTFTSITSTAATFAVSAANFTIANCRFKCAIDEQVAFFIVSAAYFTMDTCEFVDNTSTAQCLGHVVTTAAGDNCTIRNCTFTQTTAGAADTVFITLVGADQFVCEDCFFTLTSTNSATANIIAGLTTASLNIVIRNCTMYQLGGASNIPVSIYAGSTGVVHNNIAYSPKTSQVGSFALANCVGNNYATNVVNKGGAVDPALDT